MVSSLERLTVGYHNRYQICSNSITNQTQPTNQAVLSIPISRRDVILVSSLPLSIISLPQFSEARERRNRKAVPLEDYLTSPDGLKHYDVVEGKGPVAEKGSTVQVHSDCIYRGITALSSRESKLLAGNRSIAQLMSYPHGPT